MAVSTAVFPGAVCELRLCGRVYDVSTHVLDRVMYMASLANPFGYRWFVVYERVLKTEYKGTGNTSLAYCRVCCVCFYNTTLWLEGHALPL